MLETNGVKSDCGLEEPREEKPFLANEPRKDIPRFGKRYVQTICLFLCLSVSLTVRAQLSVTIVAMTDAPKLHTSSMHISVLNTTVKHQASNNDFENLIESDFANNSKVESNSKIDVIPVIYSYNSTTRSQDDSRHNGDIFKDPFQSESSSEINLELSVYRTYNWSKSTQEMITGSFFVGYTSMQLPMAILTQRYGGKLPLLVALLVNGVLSIVTPWVALIGWWYVCMCRMVQGMTQAALYPGLQTLIGKWAPASERGRLTTFIFTGSQFGTIVAFQLAGFLAGSPAFGWPASFWTSGALSLACAALLAWLGAASPADHPTITLAEKQHIMGHDDEEKYQAKRKTPWRCILRSVPVWAMVATHVGNTFGYIFLLVEMPVYMSKILHVNIKNNGMLSSLPYAAMYMAGIASGQLSDFFINRGYIRIINARRIANTIGTVVCGVLMLGFSFATSVPVAVTLLVLAMASHSGVQVGFLINQIDLAPNFAGTLMAVANLLGNLVSLGVPVLVSLVVTDVTNQSQWQLVFMVTAAIMIVTNVVFVVFVEVDLQPWNDTEQMEVCGSGDVRDEAKSHDDTKQEETKC